MPTNLDVALARKRQSDDEARFGHALMLGSFLMCLIHLLIAMESPLLAAAVICSAR